jgi:Transmembrane amino acid transporter protein
MMQAVPSSDPEESTGNGSSEAHHLGTSHHDESDEPNHIITHDHPRATTASTTDDLLVVWQGIALLTADCMGVGVLGLPNDIKSLGYVAGFTFLLGNFPINYYAGNLLSTLALNLEQQQDEQHRLHHGNEDDDDTKIKSSKTKELELTEQYESLDSDHSPIPSSSVSSTSSPTIHLRRSREDKDASESSHDQCKSDDDEVTYQKQNSEKTESFQDEITEEDDYAKPQISPSSTAAPSTDITKDLINITEVTFYPSSTVATAMVKTIYYVNLFLVLGDYILVMGRSVSALFADQICLPTAGAIASVLMFGLCQFRTMANLGRTVSLASLLALLVVLIQCLFHHRMGSAASSVGVVDANVALEEDEEVDDGIWGKLSSLAGIGFAVGSQKLFLNIRNELRHRDQASKVLAGSLGVYGLAYVLVIVLAGPGTLRIMCIFTPVKKISSLS